ncbi:TBC1 domain family member 13 [Astathelohania contejeani]|uniref:TBC1 domain family member 13 n=1 Tax=Astathelohania contejeani TaxID=164912 RepID=A0ABQ7I011_9MICR|nr:TBC1 domain family member 13 [Thelohania contejeani]
MINHTLDQEKILFKIYENINKQLNPVDSAPLNVDELKNYCYYGIINEEIRPKYWKLFLGYVPKNKFKNERFLSERRRMYHHYYNEYCVNGGNEIDIIIDDDVERTMLLPMEVNETDNSMAQTCAFLDSINKDSQSSILHRSAIKKILHTFRITNSSIGYVQGMHMVLIPIYYVFATSFNIEDRRYAEEDAYFCFFNLMTEIGENFIEKMDNDTNIGIKWKMKKVIELVKVHDKKTYDALKKKEILNNFFHFRWISLLFAQEYKIDEVIWLWDRLLSDCSRFEMVLYCAASVIISLKEFMITESFENCMKKLQDTKKGNVKEMFYQAHELRKKDYNKHRNM